MFFFFEHMCLINQNPNIINIKLQLNQIYLPV